MAGEKIKIVIVDDERDLCFLLSGILKSNGYDVHTFYTLHEGLEGISAVRPDWVILDNDLPDGLGWSKTGELLNNYPHINIINISANPDSHRSYYPSQVFYLIKPIDVNSILALISNSQAAS